MVIATVRPSHNLTFDGIVALAKSFNYQTDGLARYLDPKQALALNDKDRLDAAIVLSRTASMAIGKQGVSSLNVSGLISEAAGALITVSPMAWNAVEKAEKWIVHKAMETALVTAISRNDGSLDMGKAIEVARKVEIALKGNPITGSLPEAS